MFPVGAGDNARKRCLPWSEALQRAEVTVYDKTGDTAGGTP